MAKVRIECGDITIDGIPYSVEAIRKMAELHPEGSNARRVLKEVAGIADRQKNILLEIINRYASKSEVEMN